MDKLKTVLINCQIREVSSNEEEKVKNLISCFDSINQYHLVVLSDVIEVRKDQNNSFLSLLSFTYSFKPIKSPQNVSNLVEYEIVGMAILQKDYGRVLIRPENIEDEIIDLFVHVDIDFEIDKVFSKKYYVVASDETKLRKNITASFLKTVENFDGLEIEINGNVLMVRLKKQFSQESGKIISDFVTEINNGQN